MAPTQHAPRLFHGVKSLFPDLVVKSARGSVVSTECGRNFLDFSCGIGVTNLGHSHPTVTAHVQKAVGELVHAQQNIMKHRPMLNLIDQLAAVPFAKQSGLDCWFFWNSGAEAVEASVKLARQATNRQNIVVVNLGYHGRTYGTMALTTSGTVYRGGFGPFMGGVNVTPFPYMSRGPYGFEDAKNWPAQSMAEGAYNYWGAAPRAVADRDTARCLESLELLLRTQSPPSDTAAVLLEPVLGEGGYVPCPPGFLKGLRDICDKHGILLICDEVQTGFGRTGAMFASEWIDGGVRPDVLVCAKGIANGFPLSAIATRHELSVKQTPGGMGGTYGGNAVGCAAALGVLQAFQEESVLENVRLRERQALELLGRSIASLPRGFVREVRGKGLMIGIEFEKRPGAGAAHGARAAAVVQAAGRHNLLVLSCGPYDTLRLIPPLTVSQAEMEDGIGRLTQAMQEVAAAEQK